MVARFVWMPGHIGDETDTSMIWGDSQLAVARVKGTAQIAAQGSIVLRRIVLPLLLSVDVE